MRHLCLLFAAITAIACGCNKQTTTDSTDNAMAATAIPTFNADSAYAFCEAQCAFGPRTMNSTAHDRCGEWIAAAFQSYGCTITLQQATLSGYDGTPLRSTNIIASLHPEKKERLLFCAHWDSRPWADNDPDPANWKTPIMAANDGASGVAVMLELARVLTDSTANGDSLAQQAAADMLPFGIDFVCFDAEDWGVPQWSDVTDHDSWALGADYWASNPHVPGYTARFGVLLDMVGGQGAQFYQEGVSLHYAKPIVRKVWAAAEAAGYGSHFPTTPGGMITADHVPVNQKAHMPTIAIIP